MASAAAPDLSWSLTWEDDVTDDEHGALAALLARCFPRSRTVFEGARSWSSARPELRLVGRADDRPVAHLAVLRRFVRVAECGVAECGVAGGRTSLLVGDVGLVAVDPVVQRRGVGVELLGRAARTLADLDLPFGLLTCGEQVVPFYSAGGWVRVDSPVRMVRRDGRVEVYGAATMVLPVRSALADWPAGCTVDRNGFEV